MINQDNHPEHPDAHVTSLRLLLGSILSPKRAQYARSTTTSGTASPAFHPSHPGSPMPSHTHGHASGSPSPTSRSSPLHASEHTAPVLSRLSSSQQIPEHVSIPHEHADAPPPATALAGESVRTKHKAWDTLIHGSFV